MRVRPQQHRASYHGRRSRTAAASSSRLVSRCMLLLAVITLTANVYFLWPPSSNDEETDDGDAVGTKSRPRRRQRHGMRIQTSPMDTTATISTKIMTDNNNNNTTTNMIPTTSTATTTRTPSTTTTTTLHHNTTTSSSITTTTTSSHNTTTTSTSQYHNRILEIFAEAGVVLDRQTLLELPTWDDIVTLYGDRPILHGLDGCEEFRRTVPAVERNLGAAGMFNTGTNLVTQLLKNNCKIMERVEEYGWNASREAHGIRWQVPWGKHTPGHFKWEHATQKAKSIDKESVLPVVTIRDPYNWMHSMCRNGYTARWAHSKQSCPHLRDPQTLELSKLKVRYDGVEEFHDSLAHLWNDWYRQYVVDATYPRLVVRFEDLIFHSKEMTRQICECAGGTIVSDPFRYIVDSAKDGPGHGLVSERTGMVQAWMHYGKPPPERGGFSETDYQASRELLEGNIMEIFGYRHPPPGGQEE